MHFKHFLSKISYLTIVLLFIGVAGCTQQPTKMPFKATSAAGKTSISAKVNNWPTDTVYYATFTFNSPYATTEGFQVLSADQTFSHTFDQVNQAFVIFLTPERKFLNLRNEVLFENLTDKYYINYCQRFYNYPITTYLIEPGTATKVELTKTKRYGKTDINFLNINSYNSIYYQTTFELDSQFDEVLDIRFDASLKELRNYNKAIENLVTKRKELLHQLAKEQIYISPFLYRYTKSEIEFGAKKEFLRYLLLDHKIEAAQLFENGIPPQISSIVEFDKKNIAYATMIGQEYNEFIELYLTFKLSSLKRKLIRYQSFDQEKFDLALKELPEVSKYNYIANNILHSSSTPKNKQLTKKLMALYPNGKLNERLSKYVQQ